MAVADLSKIHHLAGKLFQWPRTTAEWDACRLTEDQISFFHENGFLAGVKMLNEHQIEQLSHELGALTDTQHPGQELFYEFHSNESDDPQTILFHALGAWRITEGFHDVLWNPRFVMAAHQLLGNVAVRFWHDQLFYKPPRTGGVVAWHQDYSYWTRTVPIAHLTCWCGLDDATMENGCVQYVPGSQRWGLLEKPSLAGNLMGILDFLNEEQRQQFKPVPAMVKAGEAIFHHPLVLHGSGENKSSRPRRAFVINVIKDGVQSDTHESLLRTVPVIEKGKQLEGQFFPLLFDPRKENI